MNYYRQFAIHNICCRQNTEHTKKINFPFEEKKIDLSGKCVAFQALKQIGIQNSFTLYK